MTNNEDMGRWYTGFLLKNQRVPTSVETYQEGDGMNFATLFMRIK